MKIAGIVIGVIAIILIISLAYLWTQKPHSSDTSISPAEVITKTTNLTVIQPIPYSTVNFPLVIRGQARVFENQFNYRVKNSDGTIIAEGNSQTDAKDAGQFGNFEIVVSKFTITPTAEGFVEIFYYSPKDGSEMENINVPISFPGS